MTAVSSGHPMLGTCVLHLSHRGANMQTFLSLEPDDDDDGDDDGDRGKHSNMLIIKSMRRMGMTPDD